jgi:hypothetical protein
MNRLTPLHRLVFAFFCVWFSGDLASAESAKGSELLVEAESFDDRGGWQLDTQFIQQMGSPYLLAHGLGRPVKDAVTTVEIPTEGNYQVWVRTFDWVARWDAPGTPGRFQLLINDAVVGGDLGTEGKDWQWQRVGAVALAAGKAKLALRDLTGFNGRCDAIYLTTDESARPDNSKEILPPWRRDLLGLQESVETKEYDLVVVGGGYSGMGAAISAARMGCRVALIQDRPVLGGNGSSEVRVWAMGNIRRGKFPRIGEIVEEFADRASKSPGREEEFGDELKAEVATAESNIDLFLNHHAFAVRMNENRIESVDALDVRTSQVRRFASPLFVDCTGHGWVGEKAGADWDMTPEGRMGMSNMWTWENSAEAPPFPETPWALPLTMDDFPYPRDFHAQWFWESGFDKDPIVEAEAIRDWNLRAGFGAFNAMKNGDGADDHPEAVMTWMAFVGGPRESRRLIGDVLLTQDNIVEKTEFNDGCVPTTWSIDLHYPKREFAKKFPDNPFISIAEHDYRVDRLYGYPVPYRCFYSRNIDNLFMAGRCISVTHEALGTVRVMKTCGMMGEVVGKAASICRRNDCLPRDVYERHLPELLTMLQLPGKARRASFKDEVEIPENVIPAAGGWGPESGVPLAQFEGVVVDDNAAELVGDWTTGQGLKGYAGWGYRYAVVDSGAVADFRLKVASDGNYAVRILSLPHENRGASVSVDLLVDGQVAGRKQVDMRQEYEDNLIELDQLTLKSGQVVTVRLIAEGAGGVVHADLAQLLPLP